MRNKIHLVFTFTLLFISSCEKDDIIEIETEIQQNEPNSSLSYLDYILPFISESVIQTQNSIVNQNSNNYIHRSDDFQYERADESQKKSTKSIKTEKESKVLQKSKEKVELNFDFTYLQTIRSNLDNQLVALTNQLNSLNLIDHSHLNKIIKQNVTTY